MLSMPSTVWQVCIYIYAYVHTYMFMYISIYFCWYVCINAQEIVHIKHHLSGWQILLPSFRFFFTCLRNYFCWCMLVSLSPTSRIHFLEILYFASALFGCCPRAKFWIWECFIWRRHFFDLLAKFKTPNIKTWLYMYIHTHILTYIHTYIHDMTWHNVRQDKTTSDKLSMRWGEIR